MTNTRIRIPVVTLFNGADLPPPPSSKIQLKYDNHPGYFKYERNWSRDSRYKPQLPSDTFSRLVLGKIGEHYEVYPLIALDAVLIISAVAVVYWSFLKVEIWLNRHNRINPMDWRRLRTNYWKQPGVYFDWDGRSRERLPIMEKLEDQMLEAAKTRKERKN
ncbi:hypothetical protein AB6A40_000218 [Gnathostoma spinigerum]|uniref:Uncharacterized protein n=1 Tax=Gnathostoma spinigerum TaxID=75299 RepID=A0ABD6E5X7_9BILA